MTNLSNKLIFVFALLCFVNITYSNKDFDTIKIDKFEQHVKSLDYISRKTSDNKQYLNLAKSYCDSILELDSKNEFAKNFKNKINLTLSANELNMNHRIQLFELLSGFPSYFAFADDPIEYAYDDAISSLLLSKEIDYQKGPLGDARFPSIVIRKNCDDEMFEIANQIVIQNSSHYIIPKHELESILGDDDAEKLINGDVNVGFLESILKKLDVKTIGVFVMNDLDVIEDRIWYVQASFSAYKSEAGFTQTIFARGFNHDKRGLSIISLLLLLLLNLILISIISFVDHYHNKIREALTLESFANKKELYKKGQELFFLFQNKIRHVFIYFIVPLVFSFIMIYAVSNLIPNPEADSREAASRLWLVVFTLGMSLFPTFLNLILVNRLDLDGFHTIKGYRLFFNTSLYTTYFPLSFFYLIKYESIPWAEHVLLIIVTVTISVLLSRSYYRFTANSIHSNLKTHATVGMIMAIISLLYLNYFILSEFTKINLIYGLLVSIYFSMIYELIDKIVQKSNDSKELSSSETTIINEKVFLTSVIDPVARVYEKIKKDINGNEKLDIMILAAPMGMGKTATLMQAKQKFIDNDGWDFYYGDCDEIQDESAISYEPFLEAFGELLGITKFSNRGDEIASYKNIAVTAGSIMAVNTDILTDYERDQQKSMTETCIEIINKLEGKKNKLVFVLEDLHFIDPETYSFLKHFIKIANNNDFLRKSICIVLTLRDGENKEYRGINYETLTGDLDKINKDEYNDEDMFEHNNLYDYKEDVNLKDFVKNLSDQDNKFKIQTNSLDKINELFNSKSDEENSIFCLTPLYIRKTIEGWIDDETLKFSPDGYLLSRTLTERDLPNSDEADKYYHSIFDLYEEKWQRLLESAAIIGNKFDAEILGKVWGYQILDILPFLERAINDDLLIDLSSEDNMYKFKDKRIVSALKSFFSLKQKNIINENQIDNDKSKKEPEYGEKQIVIEYNKRYISIQEDILNNPENYSYEKLMQVCRRLITLISNSHFRSSFQKLVLEIIVRLVSKQKFDKLIAFSKFVQKSTSLQIFSKMIENFSFMVQSEILSEEEINDKYETIKALYKSSANDKLISHFFIIISLYKGEKIDLKDYEFIKSNCFTNNMYSSYMSFEIVKKLTKQRKDFSFQLSLINELRNSISEHNLRKYDDKLNLEIYSLHHKKNYLTSNNLEDSYIDTWPNDTETITDNEILVKIIEILELSNDYRINAKIFKLLIRLSNLENIDKTEEIYKNIHNYLNKDQSLITPILLQILKDTELAEKVINNKTERWGEIHKYFSSRYHKGQQNKLVKLYNEVKSKY